MTGHLRLTPQSHPGAELLALYIDGGASKAERALVEEHLAACNTCRDVIAEASAFVREGARDGTPRSSDASPAGHWLQNRTGALAGIAALLVVGVAAGVLWWSGHKRSNAAGGNELFAALALEPTRPSVGRIVDLAYAPPPQIVRGAARPSASPDVRIAVAQLEKRERQQSTPENRAALGVGYLATGDIDSAIQMLQIATNQRETPASLCDLAAAFLARESPQDAARALDAARRGTAMSGSAPPACFFNQALAWEQLKDEREALSAWKRYLSFENSGPWADEARQHVLTLSGRSSREKPHEDQYVALFENELGAWARSVQAGDPRGDARLTEATESAARLGGSTGDQFPAAVVRTARVSSGARLHEICAAHVLYAQGARLQRDDKVVEAAAAFRAALSHLSSDAPFAAWIAVSLIDVLRPAGADGQLRSIIRDAENARFTALAGRAHMTLGLRLGLEGDFPGAIQQYLLAATAFETASLPDSVTSVDALTAEAYAYLADRPAAWSYRQRALEGLANTSERAQYGILASLVRGCLLEGLNGAAAAFQEVLISRSRQWSTDLTRAQNYVRSAQIHDAIHESQGADADYAAAETAARTVSGEPARAPLMADIALGRAQSPRRSSASNDRGFIEAIKQASSAGQKFKLPRLLFGAAVLYRDQGRLTEAKGTLATALGYVESERARMIDDRLRITSFADSWRMYKTAAELEFADNPESAVSLMERGRLVGLPNPRRLTSVTAEQVAHALDAGSAVIEYAVQPGATLVCVLTAERVVCRRVVIADSELESLISAAVQTRGPDALRTTQLARLSETLLAPVLPLVVSRRQLIVVPDGPIAAVPFEALPIADGHLVIDEFLVSYVPSLTVWIDALRNRLPESRTLNVLAIGNPAIDRRQFPGLSLLPNATREVNELRRLYPSATVLVDEAASSPRVMRSLPSADLFHYAGHALSNPVYPLLSSLILSRQHDDSSPSVLLGADVVKLDLRRLRLAYLSACDTSQNSAFADAPPFSIATAFLIAGAQTVIASSWEVDDADGAEVARRFYVAYKSGLTPVQALRAARLGWFHDTPVVREHPERWAGIIALGADGPRASSF